MAATAERRRVPFEEGYFTVPTAPDEPPRLIGSRCRSCGEHFYPRRLTCAKCLSDEMEESHLGPRGTLYTHTFLFAPGFGDAKDVEGYPAGQIDLAEGPRVQSVLVGKKGDFQIGMEMELTLETIGQDQQRRDIVMYRFRPVG
jgi:uncharacterized protein